MSVADQRILRGVAATLTWQPVGADGEPAAPADPVTVAVIRADGTSVLDAGTATAGTGSDPRTVEITAADVSDLDLLTVTWTGDDDSTQTTSVEVVGGYYFTLAEARASDTMLADDGKYPDEVLLAIRRAVEDEFEDICGVAFVPRFGQEIVCNGRLQWHELRRYRSVSSWTGLAWEPWTDLSYLVTDPDESAWQLRGARYRVAYEHGYARPPAEIKTAALVRLRDRASAPFRGIPDRASSFSVAEGGTYSLTQAGVGSTGIPDVDAALRRWDHRSRVR